MKKLVFLILVSVVGCDGKVGTRPDGTATDGVFREVNFEGHDYITYQEGYGEYQWGGLTHNPECKKCKLQEGE